MCRENLIDFSCYIVYEDGRIWSKYWKRYIETDNLNNKGYIKITLKTKFGKERYLEYLLHRVIWFYFKGEIPDKIEVCHWDCNPTNCSLDNLYLGTHECNMNNQITRTRISSWQKGVKKNYPCGKKPKKVDAISPIDGEVIASYEKITDAAKSVGCSRGAIIKNLKGESKTCKDYIWKRPL